ncbi:MAG: hypothetical protein AB8H12_12165 [Lewinella sp.]
MSAIIETRHNIVEMLFQLESVEALLQVEQQIREALKQSNSAEDYLLPEEPDGVTVSEPVASYPDLNSAEYKVAESVDLERLMKQQGYNPGNKEAWADLSDVFDYIPEKEIQEFLDID